MVERRRLTVRGVVQGVGFRPFVAALARDLHLGGHCGNDDTGMFIEVEGRTAVLDEFVWRLHTDAPPLALLSDVSTVRSPPQGTREFRIVESHRSAGARTLIPPDVATCADCLRELHDSADRRHRHPFVNCTNCGPRYTVITDLPYDRPATTMAGFPMCPLCAREYTDPEDRRFHAQPICCRDCGPRIFAEQDGARVDGDAEVLSTVQTAIAAGAIVAIKGIGGFHLVCDATDSDAVARLRARKRRPAKPFAVMAPDEAAATEQCELSAAERGALTSPARPIVLARARRGAGRASALVAPGLGELGVMLPYSPLHHLLFAPVPGCDAPVPRLLVATSGNLSGEPLCTDNADARERLGAIADLFLMHDRDIAVPCEDSVVAVAGDAAMPIRRSRGYVPLPVRLENAGPAVLAVGGEVKNTFCLTDSDFAFCSAHLGDMGNVESQRAFAASVAQLTTLHRTNADMVVADAHPGYATRTWAERYSAQNNLDLLTVQHHHAHVASLLAEHGRLGSAVLGIVFDGTGYGCDHTVWGGELLLVGPDLLHAHRAGHVRSFPLPGGDIAVRTPARIAVAVLREAGIEIVDDLPPARALAGDERALVDSQLNTGVGCIRTTSAGRLFDAAASVLGVRHRISYEAQAAIELEAVARDASSATELPWSVHDGEVDWTSTFAGLTDGVREGTALADLAAGFHCAFAAATAHLAARIAAATGVHTVGLTGGVFQNRLLLGQVRSALEGAGFEVLTHRHVPANDGGLALGQAALGAAHLRARNSTTTEERRS